MASVKRVSRVLLVLMLLSGMCFVSSSAATKAKFHKIPFSSLIKHQKVGVLTTATVSFPFVLERIGLQPVVEGERGPVETVMSVARNHCRSVHLEYVFAKPRAISGSLPALSSTSGTVTLVKQKGPPVTSTAAYEAEGALDAKLTPGQTWSVTVSAQVPVGVKASSLNVYLNGYAVCDSTEKI